MQRGKRGASVAFGRVTPSAEARITVGPGNATKGSRGKNKGQPLMKPQAQGHKQARVKWAVQALREAHL